MTFTPIDLAFSVPELSMDLAGGDLPRARELAAAILRAAIAGDSLEPWLAELEVAAASTDTSVRRSILRALAEHASRTADDAAFAVLERLGATSFLLGVHQNIATPTIARVVASAAPDPGTRQAVARYLDAAERFGADVEVGLDFLFAQLGEAPSGRGDARVDPGASAIAALARCARSPRYGARVIERLTAESQGRGARAADALRALVRYWSWSGAWELVDARTSSTPVPAPVARGFGAGVHDRIFFGQIGDPPPDDAWLDAAQERLARVRAAAPKAAQRSLDTAARELERERQRRTRARTHG